MRAFPGILTLALLLGPAATTAAAPAKTPCSISLVVGADHRGQLLPCHCAGIQASSLAYRAALLKLVRGGKGFTVIADAGDFTPLPEDTEEVVPAEAEVAALALMPYDAIAVGEAELLRGPAFLAGASARLPLVCANVSFPHDPGVDIPATRIVERGGCRVLVTAYVDPLLFYDRSQAMARLADSLVVSDAAQALAPILERARTEKLPLVVLAHADRASVESLFSGLDAPDVVVVGHEPEEGLRAEPWHGNLLIEPGPRSQTLAEVTFRPGLGGAPKVEAYRVHVLKQAKHWDARVESLVQPESAR
jgi:2',3'-cyclic-nucleotide 2'-phosphodiesterase (5'-nucleotidase family)